MAPVPRLAQRPLPPGIGRLEQAEANDKGPGVIGIAGVDGEGCLSTDNAATSGGVATQGAPIAGFFSRAAAAAPLEPRSGGRLHAAPCQPAD